MREVINALKRVTFDLVIAVILLLIYALRLYEMLPAPLQLLSVKVLLVSLGFLHAHITRKLAFPSVDWEQEGLNAKTLLIIALYTVIIYCYAMGG